MRRSNQFTAADIQRYSWKEIVEQWKARQMHFCDENRSHYQRLVDPVSGQVYAELSRCKHSDDAEKPPEIR